MIMESETPKRPVVPDTSGIESTRDSITTPPPITSSSPQPPAAQASSEQTKGRFSSRAFLSIVLFIVGIIIAATLINQFVFQSYYVDGTSMTPTLQNNDRLIIDKVERTTAQIEGRHYIPKRGQIVVLDSSLVDQYGHNEQLIKRVIGLPGENLVIGSSGNVIIKNKDHPDGFNVNDSLGLKLDPTYTDSPINIVIPANQVFVMGDNRGPGGSFDSRAFGPIDADKIQGRLLARIFPLTKTGLF